MTPKSLSSLSVLSLAALVSLGGYAYPAQAFNFGDMMSPGRWFGGDRYDDDYYDGPYGYGGGPWGGPWGGPGYGYPGYGYGGYPGGYGAVPVYGGYPGPAGYGVPGFGAPPLGAAPTQTAPRADDRDSASSAEIDALKRRIEELESAQQPKPKAKPVEPAPAGDWSGAPAFRPMNQY